MLDNEIQVEDDVLEIGATVRSELKNSIYDFSYLYSIYQRPGLEISLIAGSHWIRTDFNLDASGFVRPADDSENAVFHEDFRNSESLDVPLPLFGFELQHKMGRRWNLNVGARFFSIEIGDDKGHLSILKIGADYFLNEHFAVGFSIGQFDLNVDTGNSKHEEEWDINYRGLQAQLIYRR